MRPPLAIAGFVLTLGLASPALAQSDRFVQAVRDLAAAESSGPSRPDTRRAVAVRLRTALADWDRGLEALQASVDRGAPAPDARRLHVELGVGYRARGQNDRALRQFDAALALQPSADVRLLRALTLDAAGRTQDAGEGFVAASALDPDSAIKAYYVVQRAPAASPADRARALAALHRGYDRLDVRASRQASVPFVVLDAIPDTLSRTPVVADEALRGVFMLLASHRYREAAAALERVSGQPGGEDGPRAHLARAQRDEAANRVADARRGYQAALESTVIGRTPLLVAVGRLAQVDGDLPGAIEAFGQATRLSPNEAPIHRELAAAYAAEARRDDAFAELMAALLIDPRDAHAHAAIGGLFMDAGADADAVVALTRALEASPERYEARYALARALANLGHTDEAARQLTLFEEARRAALDRRRRDIASEVEKEEAVRDGRPVEGGAR